MTAINTKIKRLRKEVDKLDISILKLLAKRFFATNKIQAEKRKLKLALSQKDREEELLARYSAFAKAKKLPIDLIQRIFKAIFSSSKKSGIINR